MLLATILSYLAGLEGLVILLFVLGIVLVVIELLMPGFGIAGSLGIISLIVGIVLAAQVVTSVVLTLIIVAVLIIITGMLLWLYKSATKGGRVSRLLLLNSKLGKKDGYSSNKSLDDLIGLEGVALTNLRPAGIGEFQSKKVDVVTDGDYILKGSPIRIMDVEGFRIVVKKLNS